MKKFLSLLLLLSMLLGMIVLPASAEEASSTTSMTELCPCGCGSALGDVQWEKWNVNADADVTSGHYYLDGDYVQSKQAVITSGNRVVLDLRGHEVTINNARLILCYGYLAIMDSVGGGRVCGNTTGSGFGGVIMIGTYETLGSTVELYSGTITVDEDHKGSRRGGLITVGDTCTFRMYGGTVLGGTTYSLLEEYKNTKDNAGGIYVASGATTEILGGKIIGCKSDQYGGAIYSEGTTVLKDCQIIGCEAEAGGGNVYQNGGSLTVENAILRDGITKATKYGGGNVGIVGGAVASIKNSTIRNGYSAYHGGNVYLSGSCTIENTVLEAGVAGSRGNNFYGTTSAVGLKIKDCSFLGDIAYAGKNISLEGKVNIGLLNNGLRLWYGSDKASFGKIDLEEGSEIFVDYSGTIPGSLEHFKGARRTLLTETEAGITASQAASGELGGYCPHCNRRVVWKLFSKTESLVQNCLLDSDTDTDPACTGKHIESGH